MNSASVVDLLHTSPYTPKLNLSAEEEADLKTINWSEIFLFDDED